MMLFGKNCEAEEPASSEKAYTKADVMAALSKVETPYGGDRSFMDESAEMRLVNAGARVLAETLLEEIDADEVKSRKSVKTAEIMLDVLIEMAKKGEGGSRC